MSLLSVVQAALGEIGLGTPAQVVGNTDPNVAQALSLVNRTGVTLRKTPNAASYWPQLRKQFLFNLYGIGPFTGTFTYGSNVITGVTFTGTGTGLSGVQVGWQISSKYALNDTMVTAVNTGAGTVTMSEPSNVTSTAGSGSDTALAFGQEAYPVPSDLDHFIPQTGWDRNFRWQLLGPVDAQEWQTLKSGISPVGPRLRYRLMNGQIYINPCPYVPTGQSSPISDLIVMEYSSFNWVATSAAPTVGAQTLYQLDTDVSLIDEDLLTLGLKWRMLRAKGMNYAEEQTEYQDEVDKATGRATMGRNLPLNARATGIRLLNSQNVPDTNFGS